MPSLIPVSTSSRTTFPLSAGTGNNLYNNQYGAHGHGYTQSLGHNHRGIEDMKRIEMSLKSGIDSEIAWALSSLTLMSMQPLIDLEHSPFLGNELIKYFSKPYQLIQEKKFDLFTQDVLTFSLDSVLALRNLSQDLSNQQWLSQIPSFKKNLIESIKFLTNWFYQPGGNQIPQLEKYNNQFAESLNYIVDLLEPLTCYYIDNNKNDPLFNILLNTLIITTDRNLFINILKCISHLLIIWDKSVKAKAGEEEEEDDDDLAQEEEGEEDVKLTNNCIDNISESQLETIINTLLIADNEMNNAVLDFLKMYLFSEALHEKYPNSIKDSQRHRLRKLLQLNTSKATFSTLMKQLPLLLVSDLPLNEPIEEQPVPSLNLTKRSQYSGVPTSAPELTEELYKIIVAFPEPIRASTWLHCCYEATMTEQAEVTQISIWKAYETQFQEIWKPNTEGTFNHNYKPLLPAVEFIKNVTKAFPYAEAKVVALPQMPGEENQAPKKKFVIKGIQPRQFPVSIDVGNYDALKPMGETTVTEGDESLPIGHMDVKKFHYSLTSGVDNILFADSASKITKESLNSINESSHDLLDYIISEVLEVSGIESKESSIFRLHNGYWIPELVYANPSLLEKGIIETSWLKYLL
ncbi:conserved hypothetical protein [Candida dubliniensis CD36]|uniref:RFX-type winged-helix domain-containing protein n=1 Tax=Candida dubliniensis (strain CD36 / ATCC MYA-646 / CBS 7987 / NCPF 3949 / NRRL Y-17841) TaxID=573826 RepID=B9W7Z0_CANDC|nr:conserved hypothetical protein [Candida dubliniensis CD36]CAX44803.1 conserved hypothetical protein [Candida dubliniensis CD36]